MSKFLFKKITSFPISKKEEVSEIIEVDLKTSVVLKETYVEENGELAFVTFLPVSYKEVKAVLDHTEYKYAKALQFPEMFDKEKVEQLSETVGTYSRYVENFKKNLYGSFNHMSS